MHYSEPSKEFTKDSSKALTNRHHEIINSLEIMLEKGIPDLTMSELASKLKISLRTLYEIAPSKDQLITMTVDNILRKLGKNALDEISTIKSPIKKLQKYLNIVNQAVGPKFDTFIKGLGRNIPSSNSMIDYHEGFITSFTEKLLNEAKEAKEIKKIDTKAFAILLGGIGREFAKEKNRLLITVSPEESANSITNVILEGIRLES
ncbi:TetR/AcrR family transcriptional regulator [Gammaproteobacteria bacterium]|jgi:AcrR family transcriptional regulator|nr:TetR/AcrR family transcriptional regulator [Gammaproteobacteria bacterium]MDA9266124.1 TetR/AcrR family transcriptional regulator [Gammaproteobacteria bacterium]MDB2582664.1 TetR/AcrR family transcriptional regulator [Gammaproteobacteria bacterium]MDB4120339.1 TetR/AcrR family transcriptional regulator [Gammaproteobacteria bacterium]MDB9997825.1 TetR/AcrR family transcriptional regulator [bacterium]